MNILIHNLKRKVKRIRKNQKNFITLSDLKEYLNKFSI